MLCVCVVCAVFALAANAQRNADLLALALVFVGGKLSVKEKQARSLWD